LTDVPGALYQQTGSKSFWRRRRVLDGESLARPLLIEMFFRKAGRAGFVKRRALNRADAPTPEARGLRRPKAGAVVESERGARAKDFPKARRSTLETRTDRKRPDAPGRSATADGVLR
jgi:hypothetical protein